MKRWCAPAAVICLLALLVGCSGAGDWRYTLPGGYALWRINGRAIVLGQEAGDGLLEHVVDGSIVSFREGERWVCVRRALEVPEDPKEEIDVTAYVSFLLDTEAGTLLGPYESDADCESACASLGADRDLGGWTATVPAPEGARYD